MTDNGTIVPANSPHKHSKGNNDATNLVTSIECRKSIDKLYNLMKGLSRTEEIVKHQTNNSNMKHQLVLIQDKKNSQASNSGTSLKNVLVSSNNSSYSCEKCNEQDTSKQKLMKKTAPQNIIPKVIISTKLQSTKQDLIDKNKVIRKEGKPVRNTTNKINNANNPLKAISQLLREFDNVHKTKHKVDNNLKGQKDNIITFDVKNVTVHSPNKRNNWRQQQSIREYNRLPPVHNKNNRNTLNNDKKLKVTTIPEASKVQEKSLEKSPKNNINDFIDEVKEARGEAVKGPSRNHSSRLNYLAQPKKLYVQAHSEEFQNKYGKNLMSDRLQRLATILPTHEKQFVAPLQTRSRYRKAGNELPQPLLKNLGDCLLCSRYIIV